MTFSEALAVIAPVTAIVGALIGATVLVVYGVALYRLHVLETRILDSEEKLHDMSRLDTDAEANKMTMRGDHEGAKRRLNEIRAQLNYDISRSKTQRQYILDKLPLGKK